MSELKIEITRLRTNSERLAEIANAVCLTRGQLDCGILKDTEKTLADEIQSINHDIERLYIKPFAEFLRLLGYTSEYKTARNISRAVEL